MGIEIERKFLIYPELLMLEPLPAGVAMLQGYLSYEPAVRIRVEHPSTALLTIKLKGRGRQGRAGNLEFNYEIPFADGADLYAECDETISKTRFRYGRWDIDRFHNELTGLWVSEIELLSEDEEVTLPAWVRREVTDDLRYSNANLVRYGIPEDYET